MHCIFNSCFFFYEYFSDRWIKEIFVYIFFFKKLIAFFFERNANLSFSFQKRPKSLGKAKISKGKQRNLVQCFLFFFGFFHSVIFFCLFDLIKPSWTSCGSFENLASLATKFTSIQKGKFPHLFRSFKPDVF